MVKNILFVAFFVILTQSMLGINTDSLIVEERKGQIDTLQIEQLKTIVSSDRTIRSRIPYARRGLNLSQKENDHNSQLFFTMALGHMYHQLSISDEAIGYYLQGLSFARIVKDTSQLVKSYNALSEIYLDINLTNKALKFNDRAVSLLHESLESELAGQTYELKGRIELKNGLLFKARDHFAKAISFFKRAGNPSGVFRQKILIAQVYERSTLFNQALSMLKEVEQGLKDIDDIALKTQVYQDMARVYEGTGRYQEALSYVLKAEKLPHTESFFPSLVKTYQLKSSILKKMGRKDQALESYQQYMAMRDSLDEKNTKQEILKFEVKHRSRQQKRKNQLLQAELNRQRELRDLFLIIAIGLLLAVAVVYAFLRYKQQQRKTKNLSSFNKQLETRVKEKTRELEIEIEERIKKTNDAVRARHKAEESDKLKTEFLNNISHEVRTPMNRIMGFSDLLLDEAPSLQVQDYAKVIYNDSQRLLKLITDLIELSRLRSENIYPEKEIIELEEFLEEVYRAYENKFPSEISFRLHVPGKFSRVNIYTDRQRLKKVLGHLIENALKFTHTGWIELGVKDEGASTLLIYVSDTGEGIDHDKVKHIFGFFRQGDSSLTREKAGIGAGLTIVKHLTEILGGSVNMHSKHGHGTTFQLEFNLNYLIKGKEDSPQQEFLAQEVSYKWNGRNILILDNSESNQKYLRSALEHTGANVMTADKEEEAVKLLYSSNTIDLVILNEIFDNQHARKLVPKIKSIRYTLPVIVQRSDQMNEFPWEAGADGFVTKPVSYKVLMEKMSDLLEVR